AGLNSEARPVSWFMQPDSTPIPNEALVFPTGACGRRSKRRSRCDNPTDLAIPGVEEPEAGGAG
ncbi:hypothetical protein THAOC_37239, partial [Thalassiosira oceanica]